MSYFMDIWFDKTTAQHKVPKTLTQLMSMCYLPIMYHTYRFEIYSMYVFTN